MHVDMNNVKAVEPYKAGMEHQVAPLGMEIVKENVNKFEMEQQVLPLGMELIIEHKEAISGYDSMVEAVELTMEGQKDPMYRSQAEAMFPALEYELD